VMWLLITAILKAATEIAERLDVEALAPSRMGLIHTTSTKLDRARIIAASI
jgi:hypothetical protein